MRKLTAGMAPTMLVAGLVAGPTALAQDTTLQGLANELRTPAKVSQLLKGAPGLYLRRLTIAAGGDCPTAYDKVLGTQPEEDVFELRKFARRLDSCVAQAADLLRAANADDPSAFLATEAVMRSQQAIVQEHRAAAEGNAEFRDLSWGLGFGASVSLDDAIEEASIVNGIVRVEEDRTLQPRVLLEFHRYFWGGATSRGLKWGTGPFLAVAAGSEDAVLGVGLGWMWGLKSANPQDAEGFSIGVGVLLDGSIKSLGDGFEENQPPPPGETAAIRFERKSRPAAMLVVTRTF